MLKWKAFKISYSFVTSARKKRALPTTDFMIRFLKSAAAGKLGKNVHSEINQTWWEEKQSTMKFGKDIKLQRVKQIWKTKK